VPRTSRDTTNDNDAVSLDSMLMKVTEHSSGYVGAVVMAADSGQNGEQPH
jgi:hypothetical protein